MTGCDVMGRGLVRNIVAGFEPLAGAGKIRREFERWRPDSQGKDQDQSAQRSNAAAADRSRHGEAAFNRLSPEEKERWKKEDMESVKQDDHHEADVWYLVDVRWLEAWKFFIRHPNGEFPGPIDNARLVDAVSGQPSPGFRVKEHYRGVNSAVWQSWHKRYGGGPMIQREKLDLYAVPAPVDDMDKTVVLPRPTGPRPSPTAGLDETVVMQRPGRSAAPKPSAAAGLDETMVMPRAGRRTLALGDEPPTEAPSRPSAPAPAREEQGGRRRAASVRPGRSTPSRDEPRNEERRSSGGSVSSSPQQSPSQRSSAGGARALPAAAATSTATPAPPPPASAGSTGSATSRRRGSAAGQRGKSVPAAGARQSRTSKAAPKCDKCDGPHETDRCPHFSKPRERHKDAWSMLGKAGRSGLAEEDVPVVKNARVAPQPGDGSCLFHALSYGLSGRSQGQSLRKEICDFIAKNPDLEIGDNALRDWISYDTGGNVQTYARSMAGSNWGGGIEMAAFTKLKGVSVHVYEKCNGGYRRISAFESPNAKKSVSVLYRGRAHYDALVL